jgi:uncharacterized cupredoxin-like copper-binding protein
MKRLLIQSLATIAAFFLWFGMMQPAWSSSTSNSTSNSTDLAKQPITEVKISLGNAANELKFVPDRLSFQSGKRYKLHLTNPSAQKHYFTAKDFADGIWTQKVEAGNVEIKGAIHELELKPGATADWSFVPIKSGEFELHCAIAGHAKAGMQGTIAISTTPPAIGLSDTN